MPQIIIMGRGVFMFLSLQFIFLKSRKPAIQFIFKIDRPVCQENYEEDNVTHINSPDPSPLPFETFEFLPIPGNLSFT
jgi:hypothetical protein